MASMPPFPILLLALAATTPTPAIFQPPAEVHSVELTEWRADSGGNGHFYEAVTSPAGITWDDAAVYAKAHGGQLAAPQSKQENAFVFNLVDTADFWMAGTDGTDWGPWLGGTRATASTPPNEGWGWINPPARSIGRGDDHLHFSAEHPGERRPIWGALPGDTRLPGFVVEYDRDPLPNTLPYVALFGVCVVGVIALAGAVYFIIEWRKSVSGKTA
ncbi:MAG TPA: hypothetical protein VHC95_11555 [Opitutales bacterium]|nr:hypothetical protein [Opitutales bacterium]